MVDIFEPNDNPQSSHEIIQGNYHVFGQNADWYRIQSDPGELSIKVRPDSGFDVRLVLYNDQMQVLGSNYQNGYPDLDPVKTYSNGSSTFLYTCLMP